MAEHGIPEVPHDMPVAHRRFFTEMRNAVLRLKASAVPARPPTNVIVTPIAVGNVIQFTRSDGDGYIIYSSPTPDISGAIAIPIGTAAKYTENLGDAGVKRNYWVQAVKTNGTPSTPAGPVSGTSLAIGAVATIPAAPPASDVPSTNTTTGQPYFDGGGTGIQL